MHLIEQYALATGAKIDKPSIETSFYPLPFERYIVVENGYRGLSSRIYGMWNDIILHIKPYLNKENIHIVQIGNKDSELIAGCFDLRGKTAIKQQAYLLKNSLLHCSTNDFLLDIASHFNTPVVGMYGNTYADIAKPYWGDKSKHIILESHRNGKKPSFLADESPRTIDLIKPEEVSCGILKLLKIDYKENFETKFIGDLYTSHVVEAVPDFTPPESFNPSMIINLRMDYEFNLQNMVNWGANKKLNIFTNKVIDLNYLNAIRQNVVCIQQEICSDLNIKYLSYLNRLKINCELFTKNENALGRLRMKYFDYKVTLKKEKHFNDISPRDFNLSDDLFYKSNKLLLSQNKKYFTAYDYFNDRNYEGKDLNIVDDPKFWQDQDHIRIYQKNS